MTSPLREVARRPAPPGVPEHNDNASHVLREIARIDRAVTELDGKVENAMTLTETKLLVKLRAMVEQMSHSVNLEQLAALRKEFQSGTGIIEERTASLEHSVRSGASTTSSSLQIFEQKLSCFASADEIEQRMQAFDRRLQSFPQELEKELVRLSTADAAMAGKFNELLEQVGDMSTEQKKALKAVAADLRSEFVPADVIERKMQSFDRQLQSLPKTLEKESLRLSTANALMAAKQDEFSKQVGEASAEQRKMIKALEADLRSELQEDSRQLQTAAITKLATQLREEMKAQREDHQAVREEITEQLRRDIEKSAVKNIAAHDTSRSETKQALSKLEVRLQEDFREHNEAANRWQADHWQALAAVEARLKEEIDGKHGQLDELHKAALDSIGVKLKDEISQVSGQQQELHNSLKALLADQKEEMSAAHGKKHNDHVVALEALEAELREEIDRKHGELNEVHNAALDAIDVKLKGEIRRVSSDHQDGYDTLKTMFDEHKGEMKGVEAKLSGEIDGKHGQLDDAQRAAFEAIDVKLRDEINRIAREHQEGHHTLKTMLGKHNNEVKAAQNSQSDESHRVALESMDVRMKDEIERSSSEHKNSIALQVKDLQQTYDQKHAQLCASQGQALKALETTLRQEIAHIFSAGREEDSGMLKALLARKIEEVQSTANQKRQEDKAAIQALDAELRQEISGACGKLEAASRSALAAMDSRLNNEVARLASDQKKGSVAVSDLLVQQQSALEIMSAKKHAETKTALQDLDTRIREEITTRQGKMDSMHKATFQALEAKFKDELAMVAADQKRSSSALREVLAELKVETNAQHDKKVKESRLALDMFEAKVMEDLSSRLSRLEGAQKAAFQEMQTQFQDEISKLGLESKKAQAMTKELIEDHKQEIDRIHARRQVEQKQIMDDLNVRMMGEVNIKHGKLDAATRNALQALDDEFRAELSGLSAEQRKGQAMLKELVEVQTNELDGSQSRLTALNKAAIEGVDAKLQGMIAKFAKLEASQRSSLQSLNAELRDEIVRPERRQAAAQKAAIEDVESRFRSELLEHTSRLESQLRAAMRTGEEQLRAELSMARSELEAQRIKAASQQGNLQAMLDETDARLRGELAQSTSVDLSLSDLEGREWAFSSARDFMEELARQLQQLQRAISDERNLREERERQMAGDIQQLRTTPVVVRSSSSPPFPLDARVPTEPVSAGGSLMASVQSLSRLTGLSPVPTEPSSQLSSPVNCKRLPTSSPQLTSLPREPKSVGASVPQEPVGVRQVLQEPTPFSRGPGSLIPADSATQPGRPVSSRSTAPASVSRLNLQSLNSSQRPGTVSTAATGGLRVTSPLLASNRAVTAEPIQLASTGPLTGQLRSWQR